MKTCTPLRAPSVAAVSLLCAVVVYGALLSACGDYSSSCDVTDFAPIEAGAPALFVPEDDMQRNVWGKNIVWPASKPTGVRFNLINVAEQDPSCPPRTFGVQIKGLLSLATGAFAAGDRPAFYAEVTWGALGGDVTAEIDITNGATFNVLGSSVKVDIVNESFYTAANPSVSPFTVSGSAVPFAIPKALPCYRSKLEPDPQNPQIYNLPPFARQLSTARFNPTLATSNYIIDFYDQTTTKMGSIIVPAGADLEHVAIPPTARQIGMSSPGVGVTKFSYIFELDL